MVRNDRASHHVRAFDPRISVRRAAPIAVRSRLNAKDVSPHEDLIVSTQRDRLFPRLATYAAGSVPLWIAALGSTTQLDRRRELDALNILARLHP